MLKRRCDGGGARRQAAGVTLCGVAVARAHGTVIAGAAISRWREEESKGEEEEKVQGGDSDASPVTYIDGGDEWDHVCKPCGPVLSGPGVCICNSDHNATTWRDESDAHLSKQTRPSTKH